jgi:hypothetical protein
MTQLTLEHRKNIRGYKCVSPFIDKWSVWDIPVKHWVPDVEYSILRAYELGRRSMFEDMTKGHNPFNLPAGARFK